MIEVSTEQARRFVLDIQGLRTEQPSKSILGVAKRIHNIQVDTISVVSRSHNLITFNRYKDYKEADIWKYQRKGKLFEFWSHALCLLPIESFPYYAWAMKHAPKFIWRTLLEWAAENKTLLEKVYSLVKKDGPLQSASIGERTVKSDGWWDLKEEKWALECLLFAGRLMVSYREGFQKYYDLTERVLPSGIDTEPMPEDEIPRFVVDTSISSIGLASYKDIKLYMGKLASKIFWNSRQKLIELYLEELIKDDVLIEVSVNDSKLRYFTLKKYLPRLKKSATDSIGEVPVKLLSPFDNIMRERHYPQDMFGFDYKIECYVPAPKRQYGYYVLPILDKSSIAGRLDAKVHRATGLLEIKSLFFESDQLKTDDGLDRLRRGISDFAQFNNCDSIEVGDVYPKKMTKSVRTTII